MNGPVPTHAEAFMLEAGAGYRFCLLHRPSQDASPRKGVLFVHAFAEEMNKARRAIAQTSRRLAARGWAVLQIDLEGCGDSSGDLSQARWHGWQDDVLRAARRLEQFGFPVRVVWGLRLGALLAASVVDRIDPEPDLLLWQPVLSGKTHLTQFLRLKAFEDLLGQSERQSTTAQLRSLLASGSEVEVAGYTIGPALAAEIDAAELALPDRYRGQIFWLETSPADAPELSAASLKRIKALIAAGHGVTSRAVSGPSFWQTVEIEDSPALTEATSALLDALSLEARDARS